MIHTQTISTEYHPCEILPVVFGATPSPLPPPSPVAKDLTWDEVKRTRGVYQRGTERSGRIASDGNGSVLFFFNEENDIAAEDAIESAWAGKVHITTERIPPHVAAKFPKPQPAKCPRDTDGDGNCGAANCSTCKPQPAPAVEQAGTVDAKYVAENAGTYCTDPDVTFTSDGMGGVHFKNYRDRSSGTWLGKNYHIAHGTRFRPLPSPSANPPETPDSSGEPVNRHQKLRGTASYQLAEGWNDGAEDWREYLTAQLSALRAERDALRSAAHKVLDVYSCHTNSDALVKLRLALSLPAKSEKGGAA